MKRLRKFVFILVILSTLLLAVPFFIGQLIKSQLSAGIKIAELENPLLKVETFEHKTDWLSSKLHYRIQEYDEFNQLLFGLEIKATLFHGLVFFDGPGIGLAKLQGDLAYDHPLLTESISVPADIVIDLFGQGHARLRIAGEAPTKAGAKLTIKATDVTIKFPVTGSKLNLQAQLGGASLTPGWRLDASELHGQLHLSDEQLWLGNLQAHLGESQIGREGFGDTEVTLSMQQTQSQVSYYLSATMNPPSKREFAYGPGELTAQINTLDANALVKLISIQAAIAEHESPDFARQTLMPDILAALPRLIRHGPKVTVERLKLNTTAGTLSGQLDFEVLAMEGMGLAGLVLGKGNTRLEIPKSLGQHWQTGSVFSHSWGSLNPLLRNTGDGYILEGRYENKVLTVNDRNVPLGF